MNERLGRVALFAFALVSALLNCSLIPLWEGFDEAFHYGYVQALSAQHEFPVLRQTPVSEEIHETFRGTPVSFILKRSLPGLISFEDWFAFSPSERARREELVASISPNLRSESSALQNYEAQQAPLAYLLLAPLDRLLASIHLRARVLVLRIIIAVIATLLLLFACNALCDELGLSERFKLAALFCIFSTQIVWAAITHVANDWLSILLAAWFFVWLVRFTKTGSQKDAMILAVITALGLLAKAYFIAFVPVLAVAFIRQAIRNRTRRLIVGLAALVALAIAAPWYIRNLLVYRNVSGMQESVKGAKTAQILDAARQIDWPRSLIESARWSLWTGNGCHFSFSQRTLNLELILLLAAFGAFFFHWKQIKNPEKWVLASIAAFIAALLYDLCLTWVDTHGMQTTTGPYYSPCILPAIYILAFLGFERTGKAGRVLATALCLVSFWIALITYAFKLIPSYGGNWGKASVTSILAWWSGQPLAALTGVTLASPSAVISLLICFLIMLATAFSAVLWVQYRKN